MNLDVVTIGLITGSTYALLGIGLVLVYQLTGTINLAHGEVGAFGAAIAAVLSVRFGWPFLVSIVVGVAAGALLGGLIELVVVKRLRRRPTVVLMVATLGAAQIAALLRVSLPDLPLFTPFPTLFSSPVEVGPIDLTGAELTTLVVAPVLALAVWAVLARTKAGAVVRATAANDEAARLAGINAGAVATVVWVAAGAVAVLAAIASAPVRGGTTDAIATAGPGLLLRGFGAAALGRFASIPRTLAGGLVIGVAEALAIRHFDDPGISNLVVFVAVLAGLAAMPRELSGVASWTTGITLPWSSWPRTLRTRIARYGPGALAAVVVVGLPFVVTAAGTTLQMSRLVVLVLIVVSATVLAGWSGQLSLAQFALVGLGAIVAARLVDRGWPWLPSVLVGAATAAVAAVLVGLPATRLRGSLLAVATLGLAVMAPSWLFRQGFTGDDQVLTVPRPQVGGLDLRSQRSFYFWLVIIVVVVIAGVASIGRRASGRRWRAVKDNERAAAAFGIRAASARLQAFAVAGTLAGLAGGLLATLLVTFRRAEFTPQQSIDVVVMAVIGGLGSLGGAVLGVLWVDGLPTFFSGLDSLQLLVSGVGLLVLLLYFPDGLASLVTKAQAALAGRRPAADTSSGAAPAPPIALGTSQRPTPTASRTGGTPALEVAGLGVSFGGHQVLDSVSLAIVPGTIVGLIGPNGAGKTTLLNAVSGFQRSSGAIRAGGADITGRSAAARARHGLGRTFQDARLFPSMSVRDAVRVAAGVHVRSNALLDAVVPGPLRRSERRIADAADRAIDITGLRPFADHRCAELSTGTRRIVEIACLVAAGGDVLLLDEPTGGLAQREVEAFPPVLRALRDELDATVVIVEHDVAMLSAVCDRLVCLAAGRVIADGTPDAVRHDPAVIESYLGPDLVAVDRSS